MWNSFGSFTEPFSCSAAAKASVYSTDDCRWGYEVSTCNWILKLAQQLTLTNLPVRCWYIIITRCIEYWISAFVNPLVEYCYQWPDWTVSEQKCVKLNAADFLEVKTAKLNWFTVLFLPSLQDHSPVSLLLVMVCHWWILNNTEADDYCTLSRECDMTEVDERFLFCRCISNITLNVSSVPLLFYSLRAFCDI